MGIGIYYVNGTGRYRLPITKTKFAKHKTVTYNQVNMH